MSSKRGYAGNARFVEIGSPGVPFRFLVNLDTLEGMRFEEKRQIRPVNKDDPDGPTEVVSLGWSVVLLIGGRENGIDFPTIEPAMACYNSIMSMIEAVGVPMASGSRLLPPKPDPVILDADGRARDAVKAAVDAADIQTDEIAEIEAAAAELIEAGEAGEDELPPDLSDEELEALTAPPDAKNDG